ncbi:DUF3606 domain-containing protein [Pseudoxanthomonas dokdonensis]|uniref:DUF3606 domain-containing protein n=1 Tax=Pseudoxanthomonas dokdonensis TaxID=344882 RepID=UPI0009F98308|nr:DUF3606 domain-containing protein [Pseudoxanthomonas dokdonensis]
MADDSNEMGRPDRDRINVGQDHELQYGTLSLDVSAGQPGDAVKAVGPDAGAVRRHPGH